MKQTRNAMLCRFGNEKKIVNHHLYVLLDDEVLVASQHNHGRSSHQEGWANIFSLVQKMRSIGMHLDSSQCRPVVLMCQSIGHQARNGCMHSETTWLRNWINQMTEWGFRCSLQSEVIALGIELPLRFPLRFFE